MELILIGGEKEEELERKSAVKKSPKTEQEEGESMFGGQENLFLQERK